MSFINVSTIRKTQDYIIYHIYSNHQILHSKIQFRIQNSKFIIKKGRFPALFLILFIQELFQDCHLMGLLIIIDLHAVDIDTAGEVADMEIEIMVTGIQFTTVDFFHHAA